MANVISSIKDYKELLETIVCCTHVINAPELLALKEKLESICYAYENEHIKFEQWKKDENKTDLLSCELSIEEFIKEVASHFDTLRTHHFIANSQGNILKDLKEKLKENELIIFLDFAVDPLVFLCKMLSKVTTGTIVKRHFILSISTIKKVVSFA